MIPEQHWIVTADERHAALLSCEKTRRGNWRVEQRSALRSPWEADHERHRPSALGRGPSANAAQHFASTGHEAEEEQRRFARDVAQWLERARMEHVFAHVTVFAAPRFLGLLREQLRDSDLRADLREGELTRLQPSELAEHPAVVAARERPPEKAETARR